MKKSGIELIAQERKEQIEKHGRTIELDIAINMGYQLPVAAARLIKQVNICPARWDPKIWGKMIEKPYRERLIVAGALLAAEIDRLSRYGKDENPLIVAK